MQKLSAGLMYCADRYTLQQPLLEVGNRRVWRALDMLTRRVVVVKGAFTFPGERDAQRLEAEFLQLRRLSHPRLPKPYDLGWDRSLHDGFGRPFRYFTQEWIDGRSFREMLGALSIPELEHWTVEVLELVAALHQRSLSRIDLKPEHLLRTGSGWHLIDLDLVQTESYGPVQHISGTPAYLAPEVVAGESAGPSADLYCIGMMLLEALRGMLPRLNEPEPLQELGPTVNRLDADLMAVKAQQPPAALKVPEAIEVAAPCLVALARSLVALHPAQRPGSAEEALERLGQAPSRWRTRSPLPTADLIGRKEVLALPGRLLELEVQGRGYVIRLQGAARSGRSRVLQALADRWQTLGVPALLIKPDESDGAPFAAVQLLCGHLRVVAGELAEAGTLFAQSTSSAAHLGFNPGAVNTAKSLAVGLPLRDAIEEQVRSVVAQVIELAERASARAGMPIPVLVNSSEHLDERSSAVLERLARLAGGHRLLLLLTAGPGNVETVSIHGRSALEPAGGHTLELFLAPLSREEVRLLAEDILGAGSLTPGEVDHLYRSSGGLPGLLCEALEMRWRDPTFPLLDWSPVDSASIAVDQLLTGLPADARACLEVASVLESPFRHEQVAMLLDAGSETVQPGLRERSTSAAAELVDRGIWCRDETSVDMSCNLRFASESDRATLEARLPEARRHLLHEAVALQLERDTLLVPISDLRLARHFLAANRSERARPYLQRAFIQARDELCPERALALLERLLPLVSPGDPAIPQLFFQRGELQYALGRASTAEESFRSALELASRLPLLQLRCQAWLGRCSAAQRRLEAAREHLETAVSGMATANLSGEERVRWRHWLAWVCLTDGDAARASSLLEENRREGILAGSILMLEQAGYEAWAGLDLEHPLEAILSLLREALTLARRLELPRSEITLLNHLADACQRAGDLEQAVGYSGEAAALARKSFDLPAEAFALQNQGTLLAMAGRLEEGLPLLDRARVLHACLGSSRMEAHCLLAAADALLEAGAPERAEERATAARALPGIGSPPDGVAEVWISRFDVRLRVYRGMSEGAAAQLEQIWRTMSAAGHRTLAMGAAIDHVDLLLTKDEPAEALRIANTALSWPRSPLDSSLRARLHALSATAHGRLAARHGLSSPGAAGGTATQSKAVAPIAGDPELHIEWLRRVEQLLDASRDEASLAEILGRTAGELLHGRGLVFLFTAEEPHLLVRGDRVTLDQLEDISSSVLALVRETGKSYVQPDLSTLPVERRFRSLRETDVRSILCWPIRHDGRLLGALYVHGGEPGRTTHPEAQRLAAHLAALASEMLAVLAATRRHDGAPPCRFGLLGESGPMQALRERLEFLTRSSLPTLTVLLQGESGTGKSRIARLLHTHGRRGTGPWIPVNCPGISEGLFEAEMFGAVRGAYTGASANRIGYLEAASGGTLFLDEVADLSLTAQSKLLTVLSSREFSRVGESKPRKLDIHLICATNRDLKQLVREGRFRPELYNRIRSNPLTIPPLRERGPADVARLIQAQVATCLGLDQEARPALERHFTRGALRFLFTYPWPDNVRELELLFTSERIRQQITAERRHLIDTADVTEALDLQEEDRLEAALRGVEDVEEVLPPRGLTMAALEDWLTKLRRRYVERAIEDLDGNVSRASLELQFTRSAVYRLLGAGGDRPVSRSRRR